MGTLFKKSARGGKKGTWYGEFTDHTGKRIQRSTRTREKKTAHQILSHWENEAAKRAAGFIDPVAERMTIQAARPITDHVDEFINSLESAGRSRIHIDRTKNRIDKVVESSGWVFAGAITPESVESYAADLRKAGRSAQTIAHHLQAVKQLSRWLSRTKRLPSNPLETVKKPNPQSDRRRERRMILPTEWPYLKKAVGPERGLVYELAIQTGLRASEMRALKHANLHHTVAQPYVTVPSRDTKDSKPARQYITKRLAQRLAKRQGRGSMFDLPDQYGMADMIRNDLATARRHWIKNDGDEECDFLLPINDAGEQLDFHSLRHTCGAWLAIQDVHPKKIQTIMRHKTITLTMDTYGHLFPDSEPEAINQLEALFSGQ